MTYRRTPQTVEATLSRTLPKLSDSELAHFTGKSRDYFRKCANPMQRHHLGLDDAMALDRALLSRGLPPSFLALYERRLREGASMAQPFATAHEGAAHLFLQLGRLQVGIGDLAKLVIGLGEAVLRGGKRPPRLGQSEIRSKAENCTDAVQNLVDAAERMDGTKPK